MREQVVFSDGVHFKIDPQIRVWNAEEVHEASSFDEVLLLSKSDQVDT